MKLLLALTLLFAIVQAIFASPIVFNYPPGTSVNTGNGFGGVFGFGSGVFSGNSGTVVDETATAATTTAATTTATTTTTTTAYTTITTTRTTAYTTTASRTAKTAVAGK